MYSISKEFHFSASHVLDDLPEGHQCGRLHGHNYVVQVELSSDTLNDTGFVLDFGDLAPVKAWIDNTLDHRHLNDVLPFNPTAELLARHLAENVIPRVVSLPSGVTLSVGVRETDKCWAWWRP